MNETLLNNENMTEEITEVMENVAENADILNQCKFGNKVKGLAIGAVLGTAVTYAAYKLVLPAGRKMVEKIKAKKNADIPKQDDSVTVDVEFEEAE